jgi:hypothetical protein
MSKQYEIVRDPNGIHQIAGNAPPDFTMPENKFPGGIQYLGVIKKTDSLFDWLPFDLHLIHPIYSDENIVFMDYEDPRNPSILYPEDSSASTTAFDELDSDSKIVFEGVTVSAKENEEIDEYEYIGIAGEPRWLQEAEVLACPKSGRPMKFLCQLGSFSDIKCSYSNVVPCDGMEQYFDKLNFWCDGNLYIYLEPKSKIVCYTMQHT